MQDLNLVLIEGFAVKDAELSYTKGGTAVCKFSIGSNRSYRTEGKEDYTKEVSFVDITAWSKLGEVYAQHVTKGRAVRINGRLKQDRWEDNHRPKIPRLRRGGTRRVASRKEGRERGRRERGRPARLAPRGVNITRGEAGILPSRFPHSAEKGSADANCVATLVGLLKWDKTSV
jgi:single stranded DNA-binding protein